MIVTEITSDQNLLAQLYGPQLNRERLQVQQPDQTQPASSSQNESPAPTTGVEVNLSSEALAKLRLGMADERSQSQPDSVTGTAPKDNKGQEFSYTLQSQTQQTSPSTTPVGQETTGVQAASQSQTQAVDNQNLASATQQGLYGAGSVAMSSQAAAMGGPQQNTNPPQESEAGSTIAAVQPVNQANQTNNGMPVMIAMQTYRGMTGTPQQNSPNYLLNA